MEYFHRTFDNLYKWDSGSLKRLEYFSCSILGMIITTALLALISPLLDLEGSVWVVISLGLLVTAVVHNCYVSVNLVRKRLSDMGYDSVHLWWIFGLWFVTSIHSWGEPESTVTYCLLGLDVVVSMWILFSPSKK